jgi:hypothetical protein
MQIDNIATLVLLQFVPHIFAARQFLASSTTASCIYDCGAQNVDVEWTQEGPDGSVQSKSMAFTIGVGTGVKYKAAPDQCLSRCQVVASREKSKTKCGDLYKNSLKVAKAEDNKLCCVPRTCNYIPSTSVFVRHEEGDRIQGGLRPYQPLKPLVGDSVPARTCLCCKEERENLAWDGRLRKHCMIGHETSGFGNFVKGSLRLLTIKTSDVILRARCRSHCSNYPEYPYGMRSKEKRSLVAHIVKPKASKADDANGV